MISAGFRVRANAHPGMTRRLERASRHEAIEAGAYLLHIIPARAVATLQPHMGDDARFCRAGINKVRRAHGWASAVSADVLSGSRRLEAERHPRPDRGFGLGRSEIHLAARRELILLADH